MASALERVVINCSNISSSDSERQVLGDSFDKDKDNNDVGVDQGVPLPVSHESQVVPTLKCERPHEQKEGNSSLSCFPQRFLAVHRIHLHGLW